MASGSNASVNLPTAKAFDVSNALSRIRVTSDEVNVIYLISEAPAEYFEFVMASAGTRGISRHMALRKMVGPFARALRQLA